MRKNSLVRVLGSGSTCVLALRSDSRIWIAFPHLVFLPPALPMELVCDEDDVGGEGARAAEPLQKSAMRPSWYCSVASVDVCWCVGGMGEGGTTVTLEAMLNGRK